MKEYIKKMRELVKMMEFNYEHALQTEEATQIAYREGVMAGVNMVLEDLEKMEDAKDE